MTQWDQILRNKHYSEEKPDEAVVDFITCLENRGQTLKVLDLACGAGRHTVYVARHNLEAHGADLSQTGLKKTKNRLKKQKLSGNLVKCDMKALPYVDLCFDAIICFQAIYHQKQKAIRQTATEIQRTLKRNGIFLTNFLSKNTYSYGKGIKIEKDTFAETEGPEKDVLHQFVDKNGLMNLMKGFKTLRLELRERSVKGKLRSIWLVEATVED
jgi:ubiquinone/menaquinone biosynthesis C-methylase UbiE